MPKLPGKKVGIVACSGEELPEGTVTRMAALKVLGQLRPADTVTICLPLFLAGGEGDRAFARFYPTIAIDGCEQRCAARATEMHSGKPAARVVISELVIERGLPRPQGLRSLDEAGQRAVEAAAEAIATTVDELLGKSWSRSKGESSEATLAATGEQDPVEATCSCGSGIPTGVIVIGGERIRLLALPLIFEQFAQAGNGVGEATAEELIRSARIYNPIADEDTPRFTSALLEAYQQFLQEKESIR